MDRIEQLKSFLGETPDDAFLTHALALEYRKAGNPERAGILFRKNLNLHPEYLATYYHYGQLLERFGAISEALSIYEKGMKLAKSAGDGHAYSELSNVWEALKS